MRLLITGASSFVGKHLVRMLSEEGYEVFHLVRVSKGLENELVWDFKSDIPEGLPPCDAVVHLAAYVYFGSEMNIDQYNVNTVSTIKLSSYAKSHKAYFVMASMAGIHGSKQTIVGIDTPVAPENHYALSKYLAEESIKTYVDNYSILRIGGIYGLDGPQHLLLNKAISDAVHKRKTPVLNGTGNAKRNYVCVLDVAQWILALIQKYKASNKKTKETLYLASKEIMSIEEYLQTIADVILRNRRLIRTDGKETTDWVIVTSEPPFKLRTFKGYLNSLI